jgi:hypothetical protein
MNSASSGLRSILAFEFGYNYFQRPVFFDVFFEPYEVKI